MRFRLAPQGASGLKNVHHIEARHTAFGLAPQGASGLKIALHHVAFQRLGSRPARGEWIEKLICAIPGPRCGVSPRKGRVD